MTKEKIAVSLPPELVRAVKAAVRAGSAPNVSAYVAEALAEKISREDILAMLDAMLEETGGPMTPAERRWADKALSGASKRKR